MNSRSEVKITHIFVMIQLLLLTGCGCNNLENKAINAARKGDHVTVKACLDQGIDPGMSCWRSNCGRLGCTISLIDTAVRSKSWETVQLLIADPGIRTHALYIAILDENLTLAKQLVNAGAQFNPSWSYACMQSALDMNDLKAGEALFQYVMELGANINDTSSSGRTIMKYLLQKDFSNANASPKYAKHWKVLFQRSIRLVLSHKPDLNVLAPDETALMYAACLGEEHMPMLLQNGADPNIRDNDGNTALLEALGCSKKDYMYVDVIHLLHQHKADINIANNRGETPLMFAVYNCGPATVQKLLDLGARVNTQDNGGESALFKAVSGQLNPQRSRPFLKEGVRCGIIRRLVQHGADINTPNANGSSPLAIARQKNLPKIAHLLVSLGGKDIRPVEKHKE